MEFRFKGLFSGEKRDSNRFNFFLLHHGGTPQRVSQPANFSAFAYRREIVIVSLHRHRRAQVFDFLI